MQTELIYNDFILTLAFNSLKVFSQLWLIIYFFYQEKGANKNG